MLPLIAIAALLTKPCLYPTNAGKRNRCRERKKCVKRMKPLKSLADKNVYRVAATECQDNRELQMNDFLRDKIGLETSCNNYGLLCDSYYAAGGAVETPPYIDEAGTGEISHLPVSQIIGNTSGSSRAKGMSFEMKIFIGLGIAAIAAALFFTKKK